MELHFQAAILNVLIFWILTTPHEFAHAWMATRLGDTTPRKEGRLTLYPLAHVDWIGTVILPAVTSLLGAGFLGWGKPVATDPTQLRGGRNGLALVALAGPASNILLAVLLGGVARLMAASNPHFAEFAIDGVFLSMYLAVFNLLPVPPLDGSKLLLAARVPVAVYQELARFGFVLLIVGIGTAGLGRWLSAAAGHGTRAILQFFS